MAGAINEPVEDAPEDTKDSDLVNAIANVATEAGLGNMSVGLDTQGVTVNIGGGQIRLPIDQPPGPPPGSPGPQPAAPPRIIVPADPTAGRSEEHTSELQSLMRISYAVFCLKK